MRKVFFILFFLLSLTPSCKKDKDTKTSGTVTIDNTTSLGQTYFVYGFLFSEARLVSTKNNPRPDITVDSDGTNLFFQTDNLNDSFHKAGEFTDAPAATAAFDTLTARGISVWTGLATPLKENQVWVYRSGDEHYAKLRIISIISEVRETRDFAECTFEWVYQPDGTLIFSGK